MRKFLDLSQLLAQLVEERRETLLRTESSVEVEGELRCPHRVSSETVTLAVGHILDELLGPRLKPGAKIHVGWLPASRESRVFYLTNSGARSESGAVSASEIPQPASRRETLESARLAVERDGGRLWSEEDEKAGATTYFVLFGEPDGEAGAHA
jgi:hypothetical protein